jgi:hypothetical protein
MPLQVWRPLKGSLYVRLRRVVGAQSVLLLKARHQSGEVVLDAIQRATQPGGELFGSSTPAGEQSLSGQPGDTAMCMPVPANGTRAQRKGTFEGRTEEASADLYFHYYSLIQHQCVSCQNCPHRAMLFWMQCSVTAVLACAHHHPLVIRKNNSFVTECSVIPCVQVII